MCDLNGPFILCTCGGEIDKTKPHWILHRFLQSKDEISVMGQFIGPNLYHQIIIKKLKRRINNKNIFDFEYEPQNGDYLELYVENNLEEEKEPDYRFEFLRNKWKLLEDFEMNQYYHESKVGGIFKGPETNLTKAYREFMENSSEETIDEFIDLTTRFGQTPDFLVAEKNLLLYFNKSKYSMYKVYNGEDENPYMGVDHFPITKFWYMEMVFENQFFKSYDIRKWNDFFENSRNEKSFLSLIENGEFNQPLARIKKQLFELWLDQSWEHYGTQDRDAYYTLKKVESHPTEDRRN